MAYVYTLGILLIIMGIILIVIDKNLYSLGVWSVIFVLAGLGDVLLVHGSWWGLIPFTFSALMFVMGFKGPESTEESPTKKVWLLTFLGQQVPVKVDSKTLVLDWLFDIVGFIEIDMGMVSENFPLDKAILCQDGAYVYGVVSTMMVADGTTPKSLTNFVNMGQMKGVKTFLEGGLTSGVQELGVVNNSSVMETQSPLVSSALLKKIMTGKFTGRDNNNDIDDVTGMGFKFEKFVVNLKPADTVIDARNKILNELAQQVAQLKDTETMNQRIATRMVLYGLGKNATMKDWQSVRNEIFQEVALDEKAYTWVDNKGGINLANVTKNK